MLQGLCTEMWTDCKTLEVSNGFQKVVYDLPEYDFPEEPDELEDILELACCRYEAFIGRCYGEFSKEEMEAERKKYPHLTTPHLSNGVFDFDLRKCVEYMHLSYGVSKIFATTFAYRYFLIWWFAGGVTEDQEEIDRNWEDILNFFEEAKALLEELQEDEALMDS